MSDFVPLLSALAHDLCVSRQANAVNDPFFDRLSSFLETGNHKLCSACVSWRHDRSQDA